MSREGKSGPSRKSFRDRNSAPPAFAKASAGRQKAASTGETQEGTGTAQRKEEKGIESRTQEGKKIEGA
jgi:hypothetical protein